MSCVCHILIHVPTGPFVQLLADVVIVVELRCCAGAPYCPCAAFACRIRAASLVALSICRRHTFDSTLECLCLTTLGAQDALDVPLEKFTSPSE